MAAGAEAAGEPPRQRGTPTRATASSRSFRPRAEVLPELQRAPDRHAPASVGYAIGGDLVAAAAQSQYVHGDESSGGGSVLQLSEGDPMGSQSQVRLDTILIVEGDSGLAEPIESVLRQQGLETARVATGAAALAWLAGHTPALVLLDYVLPDMTGLQFLAQAGKPPPFVVTTGAGDERTAVELMKLGARDYLIKDARFLDSLRLAVHRVLGQLETERQLARAEAALQESEERFRSLLQDIHGVAVQGYGPDGTTQYWNRASERLYGYSAQEAIGRNLLDLIVPPDMRGHVEQAIREMAETGQPIPAATLSLMRKDGSLVPVLSSHTIVQVPGRPQELFCLDIDLTERQRAEDELARSKALLRIVLDLVPAYICAKDTEGRFLLVNQRLADFYGLPPDVMAGMLHADLCQDAEELRAMLATDREVIESGQPKWIAAETMKKPDGSTIVLETHKIPFTTSAGPAVLIAAADITERRRVEAEQARQLGELRRWHTVTIGREGRIAELKREVNALAARLGETPPYGSVEAH